MALSLKGRGEGSSRVRFVDRHEKFKLRAPLKIVFSGFGFTNSRPFLVTLVPWW
jgi:hypothetical protein